MAQVVHHLTIGEQDEQDGKVASLVANINQASSIMTLPDEILGMVASLVETRTTPIKIESNERSPPAEAESMRGGSAFSLASKRINYICNEARCKDNTFTIEVTDICSIGFRRSIRRLASRLREYFGRYISHVRMLAIMHVAHKADQSDPNYTMPYAQWGRLIQKYIAPGLNVNAVIKVEACADYRTPQHRRTSPAALADTNIRRTLLSRTQGRACDYRTDNTLLVFEHGSKRDYDEF